MPGNAPGPTIREMQIQDLDRVFEIERNVFVTPWSRKSIAHEINNPQAISLVAEKNAMIIGYVICWWFDGEAHIGTLAIVPAFRRKKVGTELFVHLLDDLSQKNVEVIYLEVRRSNLAAQNLYWKNGFEICGVRRNYYTKEKEDALLLSLSLKEG